MLKEVSRPDHLRGDALKADSEGTIGTEGTVAARAMRETLIEMWGSRRGNGIAKQQPREFLISLVED
jgi:hypothetical protein